jgi:alkylation response protein AidB-like acyl-CoA dehydrogenase
VAHIDSAAAWNLVMNQAIAACAAWLPAEGAQELFRNGPPTVAGALNPPAAATRVEGGWRSTGQCPFGSGCHNAQWLAMPAIEMDGDQPKVDPQTGEQVAAFGVFFPRAEAQILDTWNTYGMRGTGSADYAVDDLFVPDRLVAPVAPLSNPAPGFEGPLFRMWPWTAILGEATVSVGVAATAVEAAVELCRTKTPAYNAIPLREQQLAQFQMAKARARVEASRDTLYCAGTVAYDDVAGHAGLLTTESKIRLQPRLQRPCGVMMPPCALRLPGHCPFGETVLRRRPPGLYLSIHANAEQSWNSPSTSWSSTSLLNCQAVMRRPGPHCPVVLKPAWRPRRRDVGDRR